MQFIVIVTRGHKCDLNVLRSVFKQNDRARYVGMIGSNTKIGKVYEHLIEENAENKDKIEQVKAPIGLMIGGDQPGQIGVAIVAQMIEVLTGGKKRYM